MHHLASRVVLCRGALLMTGSLVVEFCHGSFYDTMAPGEWVGQFVWCVDSLQRNIVLFNYLLISVLRRLKKAARILRAV